ncbi:membrane protein [Microbacterium phage Pumpernickel]|uniref:Membrane protein n=1 Tax=Microbacterium phage Pumpernickel TaxID=2885983 RepID=A0AAE8Y7F1_9CAUD|nr:hypothetical protein QEH42_gp038 [Microbacterium phage Pumpernickel]YP_010755329.1 membrane protein [Microbacterium phage Pumpernickel]UDL15829.1 hypothetical protein SEA_PUMPERNICKEL_38 [Microbacterium phage Pumpernickel]UDL16089.1 membrane protein [Microbacterium phage Pumpernickel]
MELPIILGLGAFLLLLGIAALLAMSTRREIKNDPITESVIIRATTETIATADARESTPNKDRDHETPSANSE